MEFESEGEKGKCRLHCSDIDVLDLKASLGLYLPVLYPYGYSAATVIMIDQATSASGQVQLSGNKAC